jgi:hypothetical protein
LHSIFWYSLVAMRIGFASSATQLNSVDSMEGCKTPTRAVVGHDRQRALSTRVSLCVLMPTLPHTADQGGGQGIAQVTAGRLWVIWGIKSSMLGERKGRRGLLL